MKEEINNSYKQFLVGQSLVEGKNNFLNNVDFGMKYAEFFNQLKCIDSMIYLIQMIIEGDIINKNLERAHTILSEIKTSQDERVYYLSGLINLKKKKY